MADNHVIISIKGIQIYDEQEPEAIELTTAGTLDCDPSGYTIAYEESVLTGMEGTETIIRVEENQVSLTRQGTINSFMVFQLGKRHLSMYETPYGDMAIAVNTRRMKVDLSAAGGDLELEYAIEADQSVTGHNFFHISVTKPPKIKQ